MPRNLVNPFDGFSRGALDLIAISAKRTLASRSALLSAWTGGRIRRGDLPAYSPGTLFPVITVGVKSMDPTFTPGQLVDTVVPLGIEILWRQPARDEYGDEEPTIASVVQEIRAALLRNYYLLDEDLRPGNKRLISRLAGFEIESYDHIETKGGQSLLSLSITVTYETILNHKTLEIEA